MRVCVPKETAPNEKRVATTPEAVRSLTELGFEVSIETGAGRSAGFLDAAYAESGAKIISNTRQLWDEAGVLLKVRAPLLDGPTDEVNWLHSGQTLIGFLWPAQNPTLLEKLAKNIFATDNSDLALNVAKENMAKFAVTNIKMGLHDFLQSRFKSKFDVVISNPPYIAFNGIPHLQMEVRDYDPHTALTDNGDGLSFYRRFSDQIDNLLNPEGVLILEFGSDGQKCDIEKIFGDAKLQTEFFKDINNNWRVVEVRR